MSALNLASLPLNLRALRRWAAARGFAQDEGRALHHLLAETFGKGQLQPFRLMAAPGAAHASLYAYARADAPGLLQVARECALPDALAACDVAQLATKTMPESWKTGRRLAFDLRVRPTRRLHKPAGSLPKGAEVDAYLVEAMRRFPAGRPPLEERIAREEVYLRWLKERLQDAARVDAARIVSFARRKALRGATLREGPEVVWHSELTVLDGSVFSTRLASGVGRHAAYGSACCCCVRLDLRTVMLAGRLGLDRARIPHADRHGLIWLERGRLEGEDGCLRFVTAGGSDLAPGSYQIPHQSVSMVLLGPGSSITHDALRLLARHGCGLAAIGEGATRFYTAPPLLPDTSAVARAQVRLWADPQTRMEVARAMYAIRFGEIVRTREIEVLRGQEGARIKRSYQLAAERFGVAWSGRNYDRENPEAGDVANQAINHAATAMSAAAAVAVASVGAIPQLGFVHEDSGQSFVLDIADLYCHDLTLEIAFGAVKETKSSALPIERLTRRGAARLIQRRALIPEMIDRIKSIFRVDAPSPESQVGEV